MTKEKFLQVLASECCTWKEAKLQWKNILYSYEGCGLSRYYLWYMRPRKHEWLSKRNHLND